MSRAPCLLRRISLLLVVLWTTLTPLDAATRFDPALRFRTLTTEHFVIYFHQGEDALAARLAAIAEDTWSRLQPSLGVPVQKRTHVVLFDQSEVSNGWAFPLPYNTVAVTTAWPPGSEFIGHTDDWLRLVFTHEFAHIVHLDRSNGWARFVRRIFGRTPLAFPNLFLPIWQIEGLATYEESVLTGEGRMHAGDFRTIEHEAARAGALEPLDRVNGGLTTWPNGFAPYAYGSGFHAYLAKRYGEEKIAALADKTARRVPFLVAGAFEQVYGRPLGSLWSDYQKSLESAAVTDVPEQNATRLTRHGFTVIGPRFAPPSCASCPMEIVYSVRTPHGFPAMNAVRLDDPRPRQIATRYLGSTTGISRDLVVFDQQELRRNVGLYSDLFTLDRATGDVRRLTSDARLLDPDLSADGSTIVCVREGLGRRELVVVRLKADTTPAGVVSGFSRTVAEITTLISEPDTQFNAPRWSPDGLSIAVGRHVRGRGSEIVIVDASNGAVRVVASAASTRVVTPAWRPDGRAIIAAAAPEGGPFNLYEFAVGSSTSERDDAARQLTNTSGGATWPDISPDGATIVFVGYTVDGFDLFTMPYPSGLDVGPALRSREPRSAADAVAEARAAASAPLRFGAPRRSSPDIESERRREARTDGTEPPAEPRGYSPLSTLKPTAWTPIVESSSDQLRIGAGTGGFDVLGYHAYAAAATWLVDGPAKADKPAGAMPDWEVLYAYDRWRPTFSMSASSITNFLTAPLSSTAPDDSALSVSTVRSRQVEMGVLLPLRHVRLSHRAVASLRAVQDYDVADATPARNRTAARAGWATSSSRVYGFSISPERGVTGAMTAELVPEALGASGHATTVTADLRAYLPGLAAHHVLAVRAGGGVSSGDADMRRTFVLGGAGPNGAALNFGSDAFSLLRGFKSDTFAGARIAVINVDYRWPIARPERGIRTWPVFLHTLHAAVFADAGHVWTRRFRTSDVKTSAGAELSADLVLGYSLPLTVTAGGSWGHDGTRRVNDGPTFYVRVGRAF